LTPVDFRELTFVVQVFGTFSFRVLCKGKTRFRRWHWAMTRKDGRIDMVLISTSFLPL